MRGPGPRSKSRAGADVSQVQNPTRRGQAPVREGLSPLVPGRSFKRTQGAWCAPGQWCQVRQGPRHQGRKTRRCQAVRVRLTRAAGPASCAGRPPCRAASATPAPQRPQASHRPWGQGRLPVPCPGGRAERPTHRTAPSPVATTRKRPTGTPSVSPSPCPCQRGRPAPHRRSQIV